MTDPADRFADAALRIDLAALAANYRALCRRAQGAEVGAVVKADGYGLGVSAVVPALAGAGSRHFFVAGLNEAMRAQPSLPPGGALYVLNGIAPGGEALAAEQGFIPALNTLADVERWAAAAGAAGRSLPAVLQVDSGMARLGLSERDARALASRSDWLGAIDLRLVISHLACADTPDAPANAVQFARFTAIAEAFPGVPRSLNSSAGLWLGRSAFDVVRAGIALYGGAPQGHDPSPMQPVVSLYARILQVAVLPGGQGLGYGLTGAAAQDRCIATIGVGYGDGWPRCLGNRGLVYIGGVAAPIVGRVSMDSMAVDVSHVALAALARDHPVELIGPHQSIDAVAAAADTIAYEVLTRLGPRFARRYTTADSNDP